MKRSTAVVGVRAVNGTGEPPGREGRGARRCVASCSFVLRLEAQGFRFRNKERYVNLHVQPVNRCCTTLPYHRLAWSEFVHGPNLVSEPC
jgi:hypothetical protein